MARSHAAAAVFVAGCPAQCSGTDPGAALLTPALVHLAAAARVCGRQAQAVALLAAVAALAAHLQPAAVPLILPRPLALPLQAGPRHFDAGHSAAAAPAGLHALPPGLGCRRLAGRACAAGRPARPRGRHSGPARGAASGCRLLPPGLPAAPAASQHTAVGRGSKGGQKWPVPGLVKAGAQA